MPKWRLLQETKCPIKWLTGVSSVTKGWNSRVRNSAFSFASYKTKGYLLSMRVWRAEWWWKRHLYNEPKFQFLMSGIDEWALCVIQNISVIVSIEREREHIVLYWLISVKKRTLRSLKQKHHCISFISNTRKTTQWLTQYLKSYLCIKALSFICKHRQGCLSHKEASSGNGLAASTMVQRNDEGLGSKGKAHLKKKQNQ